MQSIQPALGLVLLDDFANMLCHHLEIPFISDGGQRIQFGHWLVTEKPLGDLPTVVDE
ncbi:hypothetical protein D9M73_289290 [compost metagenome]